MVVRGQQRRRREEADVDESGNNDSSGGNDRGKNVATSSNHENTNTNRTTKKRKLKVLVITMGGERQQYIQELFVQPDMKEHFEYPPTFIDGIPQRELSKRYQFLKIANEVGLLPDVEWEAIYKEHDHVDHRQNPTSAKPSESFFNCLVNVPITNPEKRKGNSQYDTCLHYSVELWRKAKNINRGRNVLACTFAHLKAMKKLTEENYDLILEDNVRTCPQNCYSRIWDCIQASQEWEQHEQQHQQKETETEEGNEVSQQQQQQEQRCQLRFYGWLGSKTNMEWLLNDFNTKHGYCRQQRRKNGENEEEENISKTSFFPFPLPTDLDEDDNGDKSKPGGNFIWGCYCYWVSKHTYQSLMETLQNDVGALLWKGKRQRYYTVKPIDKILPRHVAKQYGRDSIHVTTQPSFFRAPMLTSKIHMKYDKDFCISTEFQLQNTGHGHVDCWSNLWLTEKESKIVNYHKKHGIWLTLAELDALEEYKEEEKEG